MTHALWFLAFAVSLVSRADLLPPGFRPLPLGVHALVGEKVVVKPGESIESCTIVIRDGFIKAVGQGIPIPPDARVWDLKGRVVYAGFIDPYLVLNSSNAPISTVDVEPVSERSLAFGGYKFFGAPGAQTDMGMPGAGYALAKVTPERRMCRSYSPDEKTLAQLRTLGFTAGVVAPEKGVIRGTSALVALADEDPDKAILRPDVFQHIAFETHNDDNGPFPESLMGVIAAIRQAGFDAQHYAEDQADYERQPQARRRPGFDPALEALQPVLQRRLKVIFEPGSALMVDRAAQLSRELGWDFGIVSCGEEWRRPDLAEATGATFIVPLHFPAWPKMPHDADWDQVSLDQLRAWDWAAENPAVLRRRGLEIAFTTYGLGDRKDFRGHLSLALDRGLSEDDALAALTVVPARLCGMEAQLGSVAAGKLADLVVVDGKSYFDPDAQVQAVWIDGRFYPVLGAEPKSQKSAAKTAGNEDTASNRQQEPEKHPAASPAVTASKAETNSTPIPKPPKPENQRARELRKLRVARSPQEGRGPLPMEELVRSGGQIPADMVFRGATLWICDEKGTVITNGWLRIRNGKIVSAGSAEIPSAPDRVIIDAAGLQITPGIVDCHSHTAILGLVNEATLPSTAMVRIGDVVNSETDNLRQQLAGGVTTVNLLHGSANPIGGQNCVIKLRDGATPEELVFSNAPPGIKFALGENVKQSNWGEKFTTRFPQTRMGVRTFVENRFVAAQEYLRKWADYRKHGGLAPRRNLELEAIGEILEGKRWIHCHAYRQDEMLMLLRLMQKFGVQIATFQHALEAYKIADELAAAHVGVSTFSDWWGFKFEVYDAIPYNGSLLRDRGVTVSFSSDSSELARRLYLEAAKAVKYGGTPETEALKFVTLNPAKQLRIDRFVGSLEPGKDADFVLWSKPPLDFDTACLQTWVDGKKYFDRSLEAGRTARLNQEREELLAKAKKVTGLSEGENNEKGAGKSATALEVGNEDRDRGFLGNTSLQDAGGEDE